MSPIRKCSRTMCPNPAVATMTYGYKEATAVIGPLSPVAQPGTYDLCEKHALTATVPVGWQLVRLVTEYEEPTPSTDDLTALADAIREASRRDVAAPAPAQRTMQRLGTDMPRQASEGGVLRPSAPKLTVVRSGDEGESSAQKTH